MLNGKNILIAGATGLAGTSVIQYVLENCPNVTIRGTYHKTRPFIEHERLQFVAADLTRKEDCIKAVRGCDLAVLVAANSAGALSSKKEPHWQVTDNVVMDAQLLEAIAFEKKIKRTVFVSSASVYQELNGFIKEQDLDLNKDPHSAHYGIGWAKRMAEKLCRFWYDQYGVQIVVARAANIYGPYAKFDPERSNFIPALIRKAVAKQDPFEIWGGPDVVRDVIYAHDFAKAVIGLLTREEIQFGVFNLGSGRPVTVSEVAGWAIKYSGHSPEKVSYIGQKPTTLKTRCLDCSLIKETLEWEPVYDVENGIRETVVWWEKNKNWWSK